MVSAIAGEWESARRVELELPETGVCSLDSSPAAATSCCGSAEVSPVRATLAAHGVVQPAARAESSCCS